MDSFRPDIRSHQWLDKALAASAVILVSLSGIVAVAQATASTGDQDKAVGQESLSEAEIRALHELTPVRARFDEKNSKARGDFARYWVTSEWNETDNAKSHIYVTGDAAEDLKGEFITRIDAPSDDESSRHKRQLTAAIAAVPGVESVVLNVDPIKREVRVTLGAPLANNLDEVRHTVAFAVRAVGDPADAHSNVQPAIEIDITSDFTVTEQSSAIPGESESSTTGA